MWCPGTTFSKTSGLSLDGTWTRWDSFGCFVFSLLNFCYIILTVHLPPHQVRCQSPAERQQALGNLDSHLADFLADSKESTLFTPGERRELEEDVQQAQQHCQDLLLNMETGEMRDMDTPLWIMTQNTVYTNFHSHCLFLFCLCSWEGWVSVSCVPVRAAGHHALSKRGRAETDKGNWDSAPQPTVRWQCWHHCPNYRAGGQFEHHLVAATGLTTLFHEVHVDFGFLSIKSFKKMKLTEYLHFVCEPFPWYHSTSSDHCTSEEYKGQF